MSQENIIYFLGLFLDSELQIPVELDGHMFCYGSTLNWKNPLTGQEIMDALDIPPSKQIGIIKDHIKEAILNGDIPNEHDAAFSYMMNHHQDWVGQQA